MDVRLISMDCTRTEFVGTAVIDTIGLVIPGADDSLLKQMDIGEKYRTLGSVSYTHLDVYKRQVVHTPRRNNQSRCR